MRLAISIPVCNGQDMQAAVIKARDLGFEGLEIDLRSGPGAWSTGGGLSAAQTCLTADSIKPACLRTGIVPSADRRQTNFWSEQLRRAIDEAVSLGCALVRLGPLERRKGQAAGELAATLSKHLLPVADYAAEKQVSLLIENSSSLALARDLWVLLEGMNHPALGACWDPLQAAAAEETAAVAVPVLASRIRCVCLRHARIEGTSITPVLLGDGSAAVRSAIERLRGIGYRGWVVVQPPRGSKAGNLTEDVFLADAVTKLRHWTKPATSPAKDHAASAKLPA